MKTVCTCILLISFSVFIWDATYLMHQKADKANAAISVLLNGENARLVTTHQHLDGAIERARFSIASIGSLSGVIRNAAIRQSSYYDKLAKDIPQTAESIHALVTHLDDGSQGIVDASIQTMNDLDIQVKAMGMDTHRTLEALTASGESLNRAIQETNQTMNSPEVKDTLTNIANTTGHVNEMAISGDAALRPLRTAKGRAKVLISWVLRSFHWGF